MAKVNETYEAMVVFSLKQGEDGIKALTEKFKGMMAEAGTVESVDEWGKKKLAYEINGLTDGDYTLIDFQTEPEAIAELDRVLHIMDAVVRYMIVRRDDRLDSVENA